MAAIKMSKQNIQQVAENAMRDESQTIQLRVHDGKGVSLIYLPGVHGDWTLVGGFRKALGTRVRFVELMYPRIETWSLCDYASKVEAALAEAGVSRGWLLGESFGSQIVWALLKQGTFTVDGVILAGGFARHPVPWMASAATFLLRKPSLKVLRAFLFAYVQVARYHSAVRLRPWLAFGSLSLAEPNRTGELCGRDSDSWRKMIHARSPNTRECGFTP